MRREGAGWQVAPEPEIDELRVSAKGDPVGSDRNVDVNVRIRVRRWGTGDASSLVYHTTNKRSTARPLSSLAVAPAPDCDPSRPASPPFPWGGGGSIDHYTNSSPREKTPSAPRHPM